jgi:hypothetical protein
MKTWIETHRRNAQGKQILDCMWVYSYKFDKHGRLQKCKARLVVRGDQQSRGSSETYAATLAVRSFRVLMTIAARLDLELLQYDAVNAFVNADLDEDVYMELPPGHRKQAGSYTSRKHYLVFANHPCSGNAYLSNPLLI